jgi:Tol biopolymer transport system component
MSNITIRVSIASDGTEGDGRSTNPAISADGRYVVFESGADNIAPDDPTPLTSGQDIFLHDRSSGQTEQVSYFLSEIHCYDPAISGDGRYVAFEASDREVGGYSVDDIFVYDRETGETKRASVSSDGTPANGDSNYAAFSADGRYVAFMSEADNLVPGDTNGVRDIFLHDQVTGTTTRVSVATDGNQGNGPSGSVYYGPAISGDGRYIAFDSEADNLVMGDGNHETDIFVHDRITGQTTRVSSTSDGSQANRSSHAPAISADGRYVTFQSLADNLVPGDTDWRYTDLFVHDQVTGQTTRVSVANDGTPGNYYSYDSTISADGRYIAFESEADNLVPGDTNGSLDVFVYDQVRKEIERVSVASDGTQGNGDSPNPIGGSIAISADGRYVAFDSDADNLVVNDTNKVEDVFVRERDLISTPGQNDDLINPVYRFFNTVAGGHFFTTSEAERDFVLNNLPQYVFEGVGFNASIVEGPNLIPIYRFFNTVAGGHFFTASEAERDFVRFNLPQYLDEGIGFYAYGADANLGVDVFRFFNTVAGGHFFTTSEAERDFVLNNLPQYNDEGVGFEASLA